MASGLLWISTNADGGWHFEQVDLVEDDRRLVGVANKQLREGCQRNGNQKDFFLDDSKSVTAAWHSKGVFSFVL
jgi:hypothetical protein